LERKALTLILSSLRDLHKPLSDRERRPLKPTFFIHSCYFYASNMSRFDIHDKVAISSLEFEDTMRAFAHKDDLAGKK